MRTHRSYIWCHQEPTRPTGTRQGIHDATSQWMCCGKFWTSYVILKRVPAHERKSISRNLFIFGPMLIGTFLLILGWGILRKSLWHRFWNTLYTSHGVCCLYGCLFYHIRLYCYDSKVYHFILGFMCMLNSVNCVLLLYCYEFLSLCLFRSLYSVSLYCSVYCLCVNVHWSAATCSQPNCS